MVKNSKEKKDSIKEEVVIEEILSVGPKGEEVQVESIEANDEEELIYELSEKEKELGITIPK